MRLLVAFSLSRCWVAATATLQPKTTAECNSTQVVKTQCIALKPMQPVRAYPTSQIYVNVHLDDTSTSFWGMVNELVMDQRGLNLDSKLALLELHCHGQWKISWNLYQITTIFHLCTRIFNLHIPCVSQIFKASDWLQTLNVGFSITMTTTLPDHDHDTSRPWP